MSSFYGGKQGRTYHIVRRYDSVAQMVDAFSGGGAYSDVNYGQYVIIDTVLHFNQKSNPENGLLYRRGFDYNDNPDQYVKPNKNDKDQTDQYLYKDVNGNLIQNLWQDAWSNWIEHPGAGAIYEGQIVGPQGDSPDLIPVSWAELKDDDGREIRRVIPISDTIGTDNTPVYNTDGSQMRYEDEEPVWYGDLIKTAFTTLKDNQDNVTDVQLAFDIPQNVFVPAIKENSDSAYNVPAVEQNNISKNHPFYYQWDFTIPRGKHGQDLTQIVKETVEDINTGDSLNPITIDNENVFQGDEYLTYTITNYDNGQPGQTDAAAAASTAHLGRWPYRVINEIDPIFKIRGNIISWTANSTVGVGDLYREDDYPDDIYWVCVQSGTIINPNDTPKKVNATMSNLGFQDKSLGGGMVWRVVNIPQTAPAHSIDIDYKAGPNDIISGLRNIDYLAVDKDGKIYVFYSDSDIPYYLTTIHQIESISLDQNSNSEDYGKVKIKYSDDADDSVLYNPNILEQIKFENQDDITKTQYFSAKYKRYSDSVVPISDNFNRIIDFKTYGDSLICLYSDPTYRANSTVGTIQNKDYYKFDWKDYITGSTYDNLIWKSFGPIGAQYHLQGNYTYDQLRALNDTGFGAIGSGTENRAGWIATVQTTVIVNQGQEDQEEQQVIKLYAFDYNDSDPNGSYTFPDNTNIPTHWYQVMSVAEAVVADPKYSTLISKIDETKENPTPEEDASKLKENGLWFVVSYGHD